MKVKTLAVLAGFGSLLIAGTASASFQGLHAVKIDGIGPDGFEVWHVQAWFSAPGQAVQTVFGTNDPLDWINWETGELVQNQGVSLVTNYGAGTSVHTTGFTFPTPAAFWNLLGDYGTVLTHSPGAHALVNIGVPAITTGIAVGQVFVAGDFDLIDLGASYVLDDHAWGRLPGDANLTAILDPASGNFVQTLGQLTISEGGFAEGWWNVSIIDLVAGDTNNIGNIYWAIPSPGALALLGIAGLFGVRRRRA